jgi:ribosomal protein S27E
MVVYADKNMSITCLNCRHELDESTISGSYRDGFDEHQAIWILDQVIRCTNCDLVMGRSNGAV